MHLFSSMSCKISFPTPHPRRHPRHGIYLQTKATTNHLVLWIENVQLSQLQRMQPRTLPLLKIDLATSCFFCLFFVSLNLWPQMEKPNQVCCNPPSPPKKMNDFRLGCRSIWLRLEGTAPRTPLLDGGTLEYVCGELLLLQRWVLRFHLAFWN